VRIALTLVAPTVALVASLISANAHANAAANFYRQGDSAGALVLDREGEGLTVMSEKLDLHCREDFAHFGACTFTAVYEVENQTDETVTARGAFFGVDAGDTAKVTFDGQVLPEVVDPAARGAIDATYKQNLENALIEDGPRHAEGRKVATFELTLPAHQKGVLLFAGELHAIAKDWEHEPYQSSGLQTRHMYLVKENGATTAHYRYLVHPIRAWGGDPEIDVRVHLDSSSLDFKAGSDVGEPPREGVKRREVRWTEEDGGVHHATFRASEVSALDFRIELPSPPLVFGGPTLGIGGRLDRAELRLRAGLEGSILSKHWVEGIHVETDASKQWTLVPSVEACTPDAYVIIPSLGLGLGVPIRMDAGAPARVGGRASLTVHFPLIGVVLPVDYYPAEDRRGDHWDVSLMGRISL
jgi:hypothetical protein